MSLIDQATGTYKCDGCGKTIDVYETHLWGYPTGWSEYCIKCHTDMCRERIKNSQHETYFGSGEMKVDNVIVRSSKWCPDHMRFIITSKGDPVGGKAEYEHESQQNAKLEQEKEKPMFEPKTRGGYEYVIYKVYEPGETNGSYLIHGAVRDHAGWTVVTWAINGMFAFRAGDGYDLIPLKKRRFKTAEELVANQYSSTEFRCDGRITVRNMGYMYDRFQSDVPEGNYSEEWLNVFTTEEES